jgi:hypothetical protein
METFERFKLLYRSGIEANLDLQYKRKCYPDMYAQMGAYSQPRLTRRLNKVNKEKLQRLMDPATPINTYIEGVGFKTPYRYDRGCDPYVYVIAHEAQVENPENAKREKILLRRYDPASLYGNGNNGHYGLRWDPATCQHIQKPLAEAVQHYMNNERAGVEPVFLDRLKKKEREALALLYLLDDKGYIEGIGGVTEVMVFNIKGGPTTRERVFFLEKQK